MADLANVYVALGRFDEALDWSLRNQQLNPTAPHAPYHVALGLMPLDDDSATARYPARGGAAASRPSPGSRAARLAGPEARADQAALERARRLVRNDPDDTEGPPILAELAVVVASARRRARSSSRWRGRIPRRPGRCFPSRSGRSMP